jgi:biotin operon repressor
VRKNASKFRDKILELTRGNPFRSGESIAKELGCSGALVAIIRINAKLKIHQVRHDGIVEYCIENPVLTFPEVAKRLGINYQTVLYHAKKVGIINPANYKSCYRNDTEQQLALKALLEQGSFTDSTIARLLGYSRERVRQVRERGNYITISSKESLEDAA